MLAPADQLGPGLASRTQGDPVEPVAQQVGVADRTSLAGQHEEDGLEGVFGVVAVAQDLPADTQHHRPVPRYQSGEGHFGIGITPAAESIEELAVSQTRDRVALEKRTELDGRERGCSPSRHAVRPPSGSRSFADPMGRCFIPTSTTARMQAFFSGLSGKRRASLYMGILQNWTCDKFAVISAGHTDVTEFAGLHAHDSAAVLGDRVAIVIDRDPLVCLKAQGGRIVAAKYHTVALLANGTLRDRC